MIACADDRRTLRHGQTGCLLAVAMAVLLAGCGRKEAAPQTVAECRDAAVAARGAAAAARGERSPSGAAQAAERAAKASQQAADLLAASAAPAADETAAGDQAAAAARDAQRWAKLAAEDQRLADLSSGLKAKAYRAARNTAVRLVFKALALAADQAAKADWASLPQGVQQSAKTAAELWPLLTDAKPAADAQPDWQAIATGLEGFAAEPPPNLGLCLALSCLLSGRTRLALYEIEQIPPDALPPGGQQDAYRALRAMTLSSNGLQGLAVEEIDRLGAGRPNAQPAEGPQVLAGIHLCAAYICLQERDYRRADLELVRAIQVWPNNPASVFLTGERLAADGQREPAATSLERAAADTRYAWAAERIARRARQLRDQQGEAEPLLTDTAFLGQLVAQYLLEAAEQSAAAQQLQRAVAAARDFGAMVIERLPGGT